MLAVGDHDRVGVKFGVGQDRVRFGRKGRQHQDALFARIEGHVWTGIGYGHTTTHRQTNRHDEGSPEPCEHDPPIPEKLSSDMVASVRGLVGVKANVVRTDFSRTPVAGEDSLPFFLLSDGMSLFCAESENLALTLAHA